MSIVQGQPPEGSDPPIGCKRPSPAAPRVVFGAEEIFFRSPFSRAVRVIAYVLTAVIVLGLPTVWVCGFRMVTTPSVPRGLWRIYQDAVAKDGYVNICLPKAIALYGEAQGYLERGICPGTTESLMKRVIAVAGDRVNLSQDGVRVNGLLLPNSKRRKLDDVRRPVRSFVPLGESVVPTGCYWLLGVNGRSWDSRYYGCISASGVLGVGMPIFVETTPIVAWVLRRTGTPEPQP